VILLSAVVVSDTSSTVSLVRDVTLVVVHVSVLLVYQCNLPAVAHSGHDLEVVVASRVTWFPLLSI